MEIGTHCIWGSRVSSVSSLGDLKKDWVKKEEIGREEKYSILQNGREGGETQLVGLL